MQTEPLSPSAQRKRGDGWPRAPGPRGFPGNPQKLPECEETAPRQHSWSAGEAGPVCRPRRARCPNVPALSPRCPPPDDPLTPPVPRSGNSQADSDEDAPWAQATETLGSAPQSPENQVPLPCQDRGGRPARLCGPCAGAGGELGDLLRGHTQSPAQGPLRPEGPTCPGSAPTPLLGDGRAAAALWVTHRPPATGGHRALPPGRRGQIGLELHPGGQRTSALLRHRYVHACHRARHAVGRTRRS